MSQIKTVKIKDGDDFRVINESDFDASQHELCEGEQLGEGHKIIVTLSAETAPELQQAIDEAKAECEKVQAENESLKAQVKDLEAKLKKQAAAEAKSTKPAETKAEQPKE
ncbi:hypothetical protein [Acinetobacter sp. SA01]|uniref:hypothetical protein n=1 Tax=Acinetobacter sp. SA01 TaxID=1862567 RepID=UPI00140E58F8|nr:hypothetical protein [Acinetobacter sp. SA01]